MWQWLVLAGLLGQAERVGGDKGAFSCQGRPRGIHGNPNSDCSLYYFICQTSSGPGEKLSCPQGQLFDKNFNFCRKASDIADCDFLARPAAAIANQAAPQSQPQSRKFVRPRPQSQQKPSAPASKFAQPPTLTRPIKFVRPQSKPPSQPQQEPPRQERKQFVRPQPATPPQRSGYGQRPVQAPRSFVPKPAPVPPPPPPSRPRPQENSRLQPQGYSSSSGRLDQPHPPPPSGDFECFGLTDGDYANGCSHIYYSCRGGRPLRRQCALASLKFDMVSKRCLMPTFVPDCGGQTTTQSPTLQAPAEGAAPVQKDPRCDGLPSGIFELPGQTCSSSFLSCNNGFAEEMSCGASLKFDVHTGRCLGRQYVKNCGGRATPAPELPAPADKPAVDFDCSRLPDGDYADPKLKCAYRYFSCVGGIAEERRCPSQSLRFDSSLRRCEEEAFVSDCGGKPRQAPNATTHAPLVSDEEFSCKGLPNDLYDDHYGCSSFFYACSGGSVSKFKCAGDLAFDSDSKRCLDKAFVKACGGTPTSTPDPQALADAAAGTPLPPPAIDFDCEAKGDGHHSLGCSNSWVVCTFGRPYPRKCAAPGLVFDPETKDCLGQAFVRECGGTPTEAPLPEKFQPAPEIKFDCSEKEDGIYQDAWEPCSPHFFTCSSGVANKIPCPRGLMFDQDSKACMVDAFIRSCGGNPTPPPGSQLPQENPPVALPKQRLLRPPSPQISPEIPPPQPSYPIPRAPLPPPQPPQLDLGRPLFRGYRRP